MKRLSDGSLRKDFPPLRETVDVALQTVVMSVEYADPRFMEHAPLPVAQDFPVRSRVFFLGAVNYGSAGEVVGHDKETMTLRLLVPKSQDELDVMLGRRVVDRAATEEEYLPGRTVCRMIGISALALSKITSSLHVVSRQSDQRYNLGLNLKFESKGRKVLGYSRKSSDQGWEFSTRAVELIRSYKAAFPEFFAGIDAKSRADLYEETDFYSKDHAAAKMAQIRDWLKTHGVKDLESVPLENESLTKEYVAQIEATVDQLLRARQGQAPHFITVKNVPRHAVLKPSHAVDVLKEQKFRLGDRVIFVQDSGNVPFANRGTVIGIGEGLLDVVFDRTFITGISLGGRCVRGTYGVRGEWTDVSDRLPRSSDYRSMAVPAYSVLNLTNPQPPFREPFVLDTQGPQLNLNPPQQRLGPRPADYGAQRSNAWEPRPAGPPRPQNGRPSSTPPNGRGPSAPAYGTVNTRLRGSPGSMQVLQRPGPMNGGSQNAAPPSYGRPLPAGPQGPAYGQPRGSGQFQNYGRPPPRPRPVVDQVRAQPSTEARPRPAQPRPAQPRPAPVRVSKEPADLQQLTGGLKNLLGIGPSAAQAERPPPTGPGAQGEAAGDITTELRNLLLTGTAATKEQGGSSGR